jgi:hypothetical protein
MEKNYMKFKILVTILLALTSNAEKLEDFLLQKDAFERSFSKEQIKGSIGMSQKQIKISQKRAIINPVKDKIYFSKELNPRKNSGNSFLIFWGDNNFYELSTKEYHHLTVKRFMQHIKGEKKLLLKKMTTMKLKGKYYKKNNAFYLRTIFGDVKIEMLDEKHIQCNGREYSLVE